MNVVLPLVLDDMEGYERIYVVSEIYLDDNDCLCGSCCEVAFRDLNEAKIKYEELKKDALENLDALDIKYEEDEYGEYAEFFQETVYVSQPRTDRKTLCVIKIEHLDLKK